MPLTINQLINNVHDWARARGIYEHSTFDAQMLKALSEAGELCDAAIKNDAAGIKDAIGDVLVCLINAAEMTTPEVAMDFREAVSCIDEASEKPDTYQGLKDEAAHVPFLLSAAYRANRFHGRPPLFGEHVASLPSIAYTLTLLARHQGYTLRDALESAWNEIKDRKGHMIAGGAFVKEPEPTAHPDQLALNLEGTC